MPLNLKKVRLLMNGRTQTDVAAAAKMWQPALARILAGTFDPKLSTVERLAEALRCSVKDILN